MGNRAYNFNAGPAALPLAVLEQAQSEFVDYNGIGMSVMEISHRSKEYDAINTETQNLFKELLSIPDGYKVLFLQGGASTQFAMVPLNFLPKGKKAGYVMTGSWSEKALKEAKLIGETEIVATSEADHFTRVPNVNSLQLASDLAYVHITSNETIGGIQYKEYPNTKDIPLVADMSSDILSRPVNVGNFALIYAGAQKNLGPSGVTLVIIREDWVEKANKELPTMLKYATHVKSDSLYNTPPAYSVYVMNLVLKWVKGQGGLSAIARRNEEKAKLLYDAIDRSGGFYKGVAANDSRSLMNITFRLANEELEKAFVKESGEHGFVGLKGHRSVGGLRASAYNAVPVEACKALAEFMADFQKRHG
ncbi:MAG TPA: 3-phosphoserine/phosphohydroxythreonine transaminase [Bacilli bacterium]